MELLREDPNEISAELAAVVLRNLSLQNPVNRAEIQVPFIQGRQLSLRGICCIRLLVVWIHCCVCFLLDRSPCMTRCLASLSTSKLRQLG